MTMLNIRKKDTEFRIGDIIEARLCIELQIPPEDEEKTVINAEDYDTKYDISFHYPRDLGCMTDDFTIEAGYCPYFGDDIEQYIKDNTENIGLDEIADYEIFDIVNEGDYQTAKIKVLALK